MVFNPQTRISLLVRLQNHADGQAWEEFLTLYQPVLYRMARSRGYQDADACEVVQDVLLTISKKIDSFEARRSGSFRVWLSVVVRNHCINLFARQAKQTAIGGSEFVRAAAQQPDHRATARDAIELELEQQHRHQLFQWAAEKVQADVSPETWQAFWQTCVLDENPSLVARELKRSVGAIYVARSRVLAKLRSHIETYQSQFEESQHD